MSSGIKSFVSEKQLEEKRKVRQEEWEKLRKPEDPVEAPEEVHDSRSLFERLQEQKDKKQDEFEEQLKFKNQFRGIDQDESNFLSDVSKRNFELDKQKRDEEKRELEDFRTAVAQSRELPNVPIDSSTRAEDKKELPKKSQVVRKNPQQSILKNAVKRKVPSSQTSNKEQTNPCPPEKIQKSETESNNADKNLTQTIVYPSATKLVGVLPGLAAYSDDKSEEESESDSSSDDSGSVSNNLLSSIVHKSR
ncbi:PSME3-interacting protein-like [Styela clava]